MGRVTRLPRPSARAVARRVAGQFLVVPTARCAADLGAVFTLNEVAARIWQLLPVAKDRDDLLRRLREEFDVGSATLEADLDRFLAEGLAAGLLTEAP